MSITERLAAFAGCAKLDSLPPEVVLAARRALLDTIGVTLAGVAEEGSALVLAYAREAGGAPAATVLASGLRTSAALAALVNGAFGHALDFDDVGASIDDTSN